MLVNPIYSEYLQTGTLASSEYPNSISSVFALLRKINNLQVQIYINLKTVNRFKYKMDYSLVILSMCVQQSTRIKGVKDRRHFLRKIPPNLALFGWKMAKIWL